jgi:hypothetical protein
MLGYSESTRIPSQKLEQQRKESELLASFLGAAALHDWRPPERTLSYTFDFLEKEICPPPSSSEEKFSLDLPEEIGKMLADPTE